MDLERQEGPPPFLTGMAPCMRLHFFSKDSTRGKLRLLRQQGEMEYRDIGYVTALYKIFDEILVNAADNLQRDSKMKAGACNCV